MDLAGARVVVTGASRGIGEAIAREVARRGAVVAGVARDEERLRTLAGEIGGSFHPTDLTDPAEVGSLIERIEDEAGPIDVLVNNAGFDATAAFTDQRPEDLDRIFRLNLITPVQLCRDAILRMERRGRGHLVNISSMAGAAAVGGLVAYASTKAGLTHFSQVLRLELRRSPIGVTVVQLGPVPSDMLDGLFEYEPTRRSFARLNQLRLIVDVDRDDAAAGVADGIEKGKAFVRLPRRAVPFPMFANVGMWLMPKLLVGIPQR